MVEEPDDGRPDGLALADLDDVLTLPQEGRRDKQRVEGATTVIAPQQPSVDPAEAAGAVRNLQEGVRRGAVDVKGGAEEAQAALDGEGRQVAVVESGGVLHGHGRARPAMLVLLSVEDDAVGDALAVLLKIAEEVGSGLVLDDDLERPALRAGLDLAGGVFAGDEFDEGAVVEDPGAVVESGHLDGQWEALGAESGGVAGEAVVAADVLQGERAGRRGDVDGERVEVVDERRERRQGDFAIVGLGAVRGDGRVE